MTNLRDREWQSIYESKPEQVRAHLVKDFYEPALERSQQYDRIAGYFSVRHSRLLLTAFTPSSRTMVKCVSSSAPNSTSQTVQF